MLEGPLSYYYKLNGLKESITGFETFRFIDNSCPLHGKDDTIYLFLAAVDNENDSESLRLYIVPICSDDGQAEVLSVTLYLP